jgi:hypothetical protein
MAAYKILTRNGVADAGQASVTGLAADLAKPGAKLLLHLHGGLIDEETGLSIADRLIGPPPDGLGLKPEWTQAYVIWRTGAFQSIAEDWEALATKDRLYQAILRRLLSFAARKLALPIDGRGGAPGPVVDDTELLRRIRGEIRPDEPVITATDALDAPAGARAATLGPQDDGELALEFQDELTSDLLFQSAVADVDAVVNLQAEGRGPVSDGVAANGAASLARLDEGVRTEILANAPDGTTGRRGPVSVAAFILKHAGRIAYRCFQRIRKHRDHGLHATVVEELCRELYGDLVGAAVWGQMVKHAGDHFGPNGWGNDLVALIKARAPEKIVVTAHSAGSIWAARLLLALQAAGVQATVELFLLAPAVRQDLFAQALSTAGGLIGRCRMLTMRDDLERRDGVLGHDKRFIYPSSLLYLVSGLFEETGSSAYPDAPILGMQRFAAPTWLTPDETKSAQRVATFFQQPDKGILYAQQEGVTMSDTHGDFDDDHATLATVLSLF